MSPPTEGRPGRAIDWRAVLAVAAGRPPGPDRRSFQVGGLALAAVVPLAAIDSAIAMGGPGVLHLVTVVLGVAVLAWCMVVLVTAYRRLGDERGGGDARAVTTSTGAAARQHWFIVLWSVTALLYSIETMSASAGLVSGGLDTARLFFLWQVADTLPVFAVPDTLGWKEPQLGLVAAGVLTLLLKVLLVLPLIRIAVAAFRLVDENDGADPLRYRLFAPRGRQEQPDGAARFDPLRAAGRSIRRIVLCGVALALALTVCNWMGPTTAWLAARLPGSLGRGVRSAGGAVLTALGPRGVQAVVLMGLAALLSVATVRIVYRLVRVNLAEMSGVVAGAGVLAASLAALLLVLSSAVVWDLLLTCLIAGRPPMIEAFWHLEWYAWHVFDVVPELTVPGALDWSRPATPRESWSGPLLLVVKLVALLVVAVPVARVLRVAGRTWLNGSHEPTPQP